MLDLFLIKTTKDRLASLSHENRKAKSSSVFFDGIGPLIAFL